MNNLPWLVAGDFNEILHADEKDGGAARTQLCMQVFNVTLSDCGLDDLGYTGDKFSWRRGQIRERLDRATGNLQWANLSPGFSVSNEEFDKSHHKPILITTDHLLDLQRGGHLDLGSLKHDG